ncbi:hypothetical protein BQ8794_220121 [Mesorhizobium prunaredense]|uniref:Uncharacterized protein n=1 Tax=Mesorhizobium prunaredense TaxID=1631249 RepID=A0A1R3V9U3_9HYPH|nr:hypothetical protein BQ8794_220121 [Mesorhizobium prunaredense]
MGPLRFRETAPRSGVAVSYYLQQRGCAHHVLERGRIGETCRTQRWDAFRLNSTSIRTILPVDSYDGADPWGDNAPRIRRLPGRPC